MSSAAQPEEQVQGSVVQAESSQTSTRETEGIEYPDPYTVAPQMAKDFLAKLGYDVTNLVVSMVDFGAIIGNVPHWDVVLADNQGDYARVSITEDLSRPVQFKLYKPYRNIPPHLAPAPDLYKKVAELLELESQGYRFAPWKLSSASPTVFQYRKYTAFGEYEVAYERATIIIGFESGNFIGFVIDTQPLTADAQVKITAHDALNIAIDAMRDYMPLRHVHTELLMIPPGTLGNEVPTLTWEVCFENGAYCLVNADGTTYLGYEVPGRPPAESSEPRSHY